MNSKDSAFLLVQTAIGDYRQQVLSYVENSLGKRFKVLCGPEYFEKSTVTRVELKSLYIINNFFFLKRSFLFQFKAINASLSAESVILEMNPRIISNWIIIFLRKAVNKKTVLWGHAWPRQGKEAKSDRVRNIMRSLGDHILVYTETQKAELSELMPLKSISSAPNALYSKEQMWVDNNSRKDFLYVGRVVKQKRPDLMIRAFNLFYEENKDACLNIVGDGPFLQYCKELVNQLGLESNVKFWGHISDISELRKLYSTSICSISPGYVGLSITQSFSFGTPMILADNEPHSPEIEAAIEGVNSLSFRAGSKESLKDKMLSIWHEREMWKKREEAIIEDCKARYSIELMGDRIIEALEKCKI